MLDPTLVSHELRDNLYHCVSKNIVLLLLFCASVLMSMFAAPTGGPAGANRHIVSFKAGRSVLEPGDAPTRRKVVAEPAKGLCYVTHGSDQMPHFYWKNRESGGVVEDHIVMPGSEFKAVKGCPDGEVYCLKLFGSDRKDFRFYWIQEPVVDKDLVKKVNDALNKPVQSARSVRMPARGGISEHTPDNSVSRSYGNDELNAIAEHLDPAQLLELLEDMDNDYTGADTLEIDTLDDLPALPIATQPSDTSTRQPAGSVTASQISELQHLIAELKPPQRRASAQQQSVNLADVISGVNAAETVRNNGNRLLEHLPANDDPHRELVETVHSPQFRQAASSLGEAIQTGQMGPVLTQFGVTDDARKAADNGDLLEFSKKLTEGEQNAAKKDEQNAAKKDEQNAAKKDEQNAAKKDEQNAAKKDDVDDSVEEPEAKRGKHEDPEDL